MNRVAAIEQALQIALTPTTLTVEDDSPQHRGHTGHAGKGHFHIYIVSEYFNHQPLRERHRLVYAALKDLMETEIHAVQIVAKTPAELLKEAP